LSESFRESDGTKNEEELNMTILKNFDLEALMRDRARRAAGGGVDLEAGINQISPDIAKLKIGETAQITIPNASALRKFVMSITAKLNNLTPKGGKWEGRQFKVVSDGEKFVYVQRAPDNANPVVRKRGNGGGRRKAVAAAASGTGAAQVSGGETEKVRA
jgi:hypothetical protein